MNNVKMWIDEGDVEESALVQIKTLSTHPRLFKHVAIMPDVHMGMEVPIGCVLPLKNAIMPVAVGCDLSCGLIASKSNIKSVDFEHIYNEIKKHVPMGFKHRSPQLHDMIDHDLDIEKYQKLYPKTDILSQLGTLGGGNHFIELQKDEEGFIWIMIHSGSRNIGLQIANRFIALAEPEGYFDADSVLGKEYLEQMTFATDFAYQNRMCMMKIVQNIILKQQSFMSDIQYPSFEKFINISHNYVEKETHFNSSVWVHRKGATKATGVGIIPGSMGTYSYIVQGKSCADSFNSCSHGSGRLMSRTAAKGKFNRKKKVYKTEGCLNVTDFKDDMSGVFSRNIDRDHLDEAPRAYKDITQVMENQKELVDISVKLRPIFNMKG